MENKLTAAATTYKTVLQVITEGKDLDQLLHNTDEPEDTVLRWLQGQIYEGEEIRVQVFIRSIK